MMRVAVPEVTGRNFFENRQPNAAYDLAGNNCVAIHERLVVWRRIDVACNVGRQHSAEGVSGSDRLCGTWPGVLLDLFECFFDADHCCKNLRSNSWPGSVKKLSG